MALATEDIGCAISPTPFSLANRSRQRIKTPKEQRQQADRHTQLCSPRKSFALGIIGSYWQPSKTKQVGPNP